MNIKRIIENYTILFPVLPALPFVFALQKARELFPVSVDQAISYTYFILSIAIPGIMLSTGVSDQLLYGVFNAPYLGRFITGYIFIIFIFGAMMPRAEL